MTAPTIDVHLPSDAPYTGQTSFDENKIAGAACGLFFGQDGWADTTDAVITNPSEGAAVNCPACLALQP